MALIGEDGLELQLQDCMLLLMDGIGVLISNTALFVF